MTDTASKAWWRSAVIYQIYPRSWADANGDGIGDLPGIIERLPHLHELGVDAVWLSPFYTSPQADAGYDVADYCAVDPLFGELSDAETLISRAHDLGLRVIVDLVPNHTSDEHSWFRAALAAEPGSGARDRYYFRDGRGPGGESPPNNWQSVFGGPAWERTSDASGQWYLHLFDRKQPDLNWENVDVRVEFERVLRFWLDRGADGFRVDVAHGMVKAAGLPDWSGSMNMLRLDDGEQFDTAPMWDQPGVHEIFRSWRQVLDSYDGERVMCAEAWVTPPEHLAAYVRADEYHQAFNFEFLETEWAAPDLRDVIERTSAANTAVGAPTTWVLSNHDVVRHATRFGYPKTLRLNGVGADDPQPDADLGLRRARAATAMMLALPGGAYLFQGEELGLPEHTSMPDADRQDPTFERTGHRERGRDGCRVPMAWEKDSPAYGFNDSGATWLPQPDAYGGLALDQQRGVKDSTYELYRTLLRVRRERGLGTGELHWVDAGDDAVAFDNGALRCVTNLGSAAYTVPAGWSVLLSSAPETDAAPLDTVPTDTTAWLTRD